MVVLEDQKESAADNNKAVVKSHSMHSAVAAAAMTSRLPTYLNSPYLQPTANEVRFFMIFFEKKIFF